MITFNPLPLNWQWLNSYLNFMRDSNLRLLRKAKPLSRKTAHSGYMAKGRKRVLKYLNLNPKHRTTQVIYNGL